MALDAGEVPAAVVDLGLAGRYRPRPEVDALQLMRRQRAAVERDRLGGG